MALRINGERIEDDVIDGEFSRIKAYYESLGRVSCCERDGEFRRMAKDNLTARVLLMQEAERNGREVSDEEVQAAYEKLIREHGAREHVLLEAGLTLGDEDLFLSDLRSNLRMENMLAERCGDAGREPDEQALREFYETHIDQYRTAEEVRAVHIFKSPQPVERRREIYDSLREARKRAVAGEDFLSLAEEVSDKPLEEADLGFFKQGEILEEFETIVFSLPVGEVTPVFLTQWGFHLAKVTDRRPAAPIPFDEVRDRVVEDFRLTRRRSQVDLFVEELQQRAEIVDEDPETEEEAAGTHAHAH